MFRLIVLSAFVACALGASIPGGLTPLWEARIVGGTETTIEQFPYTVSMQYYSGHRCGGAIYSKNVIVSAAHCVQGISASALTIRAGSKNRSGNDEAVVIPVKSYVMHQQYSSQTIDNDIAILFLSQDLTFGTKIKAIPLATRGSTLAPGTIATCSGWGSTYEGGYSASVLRFVDVGVVTIDQCRAAYGKSQITDSMMCAGEEKGGKDACQGDSGGPLVAEGALVGVVSWGYGCARPGYPGVYASVSYLRDWIDRTVAASN